MPHPRTEELRALRLQRLTYREISARTGISRASVQKIICQDPAMVGFMPRGSQPTSNLGKITKAEANALIDAGVHVKEIAFRAGLDTTRVYAYRARYREAAANTG